jgi:hypothetical protein
VAKGDKQTQQQTQNSSTTPWAAAQPLLSDLISQYSGLSTEVTPEQRTAAGNLVGAAGNLPNFGGAGTEAVNRLFSSSTAPQVGMLSDAYQTLQKNIGGTASGAELDPYSTPGFSDAIGTLTNDITNKVKSVYAGSGRDPSGAGSFAGSLGRGLTQGIAPVISAQFNQNNANRFNAANTLYNAGGSTASGITGQNQIPLSNAATALGLTPGVLSSYLAPGQAQLGAANTQFSQPFSNMGALLQPATALGGLGQQSTGTGTAVTQQPQSLLSNILGGVTGGVGLLSAMGGSGGGMAALAPLLALSDERAKDDVEEIGKLHDGQSVYRFTYKGSDIPQIGLLAQRVAEVEPDAVGHFGAGLLGVDLKRATDRAASMRRAA